MKKIIALLLIVLSMLLVACGTEPPVATPDTPVATPDIPEATPDEPEVTTQPTEPTTLANDRFDPETYGEIIGNWVTTITLDGEMFNLTEMEEKVQMTLVYQLNADGTYFRGVEEEEYHAAIASYGAAVEKFMLDRLYAKFVAEKTIEGISKKKIPTLWEETQKSGAEEQARRFVEGLYLDYRFSQLTSSGDYFVENSILWFSRTDGTYEPCGYTLSEEGLTITEVENPKIYKQLKLELPLQLTKPAADVPADSVEEEPVTTP